MPSSRVSYCNNTAPFWDFVASMEEQGSQHPFFGNRERADESDNERHRPNPWTEGWAGFPFGPMPHRGRHGPPHGHHHGPPPEAGSGGEGPADMGQDPEAGPSAPGDRGPHHGPHGRRGPKGPGPHHGPGFRPHYAGEGPAEMELDPEEGSSEPREPHSPRGPHGHRGHKGPGPHHGPGPRSHSGGRHGGRGRGGFGGRGRGGPTGGLGRHGFGGPMGFGPLAEMFQAQLFGDNNNSNDKDEDFKPEVDVFDTTESFVVHVSLPGAKKDDVGVNWDAEKSELSIAGVIYRPADEETLKTLALDERRVGPFERKVRLGSRAVPAQVDIEAISAKLEDGILRIEVPKLDSGYVEIKQVDIE
ncbi:HSP20-like chaperone [Teratosphaeria nubilosa]|uniref:HSP20-like chaperone n=1 Tax=Teratosphaeria nubilosa TaxID=161662 RepID=A0A6G1L3W9_9PEZI|nr:HSP20-like chaperone [Teratosphaeria nubilosa]